MMRFATGEGRAVDAEELERRLPWKVTTVASGCAFIARHPTAEALENAVMNKLERLAEELRALGIEF